MNSPKELLVVLALAGAVFLYVGRHVGALVHADDFRRRRNVWLLLTAVALLSPSLWIYMATAALVLWWAGSRDRHPASVYVLAFVIIPPVSDYIPTGGLGTLFPMNQGRLLTLVVLLPFAFRLLADRRRDAARWSALDLLVVAYVLLQIVLLAPYETGTSTARRAFMLTVDILVPYWVVSRAARDREALSDALASFVTVAAVMAAIGIFESVRGWLLYANLAAAWNLPVRDFIYMSRGGFMRSSASAGHALTLGYLLSMALAATLGLKDRLPRWPRRLLVLILCLGVYSTQSRGPWLTAVFVYFVYLALAPEGTAAFVKSAMLAGLAAVGIALTPYGQRAIELMPFIGTAEQANVDFRARLAQESWKLIQQNPLLGDPFVTRHLQQFKVGGLIDMMNAYVSTALFYGIVGAGLLVLLFAVSAFQAWRVTRQLRRTAPEASRIGAGLIAACAGSLFFMATASIDWYEYVLIGFLCGFATWRSAALLHAAPGPGAGIAAWVPSKMART